MKNILKLIIIVMSINLFTSCESTNLDLQDNPITLDPDSANPDYILNGILFGLGNNHIGLSNLTDPIVRHVNQFGSYTNNIAGLTSSSIEGPWQSTYQVMNNLKLLKELSNDQNLPHHVGMAKICNAFQLFNLVDYLGKATYSEAVNPDAFPSPGLDEGEFVYAEVINLLKEAIVNLNENAAYTHTDAFYNGNTQQWIKVANSLIIRAYVQMRKATNFDSVLVAQEINTIVNSGMYISTIADDFQIAFTGNENNPDTRHPLYIQNYLGGASVYMSLNFIDKLLFGKSVEDPRLKHYIYRQTIRDPNHSSFPEDYVDDCTDQGFSFTPDCYLGDGYWGRIHADDSGISNDNQLRPTYGAYPIGGAFDTDTFVLDILPINEEGTTEYETWGPSGDGILDDFRPAGQSSTTESGAGGIGIHPMITSFQMNFLLAEAQLFIPGVNGDASTYLNAGMQDSFDKVSAFSGQPMVDVVTYMNDVNTSFTGSDEAKLEVIITESYIASFGNSIDSYNAYRRTGYPEMGINFQSPGQFPRSIFYPNSELISNDNTDFTQKTLDVQVFWDTNPAGFID